MAAVRDKGRQFHESAFAVPDLHDGERVGDGDRPLFRRHRRFHQHDLYRLSGAAPPATRSMPFLENDAVLGDVDEHFKRRLSQRGDDAEAGARRRASHRGDRQARSDPDLRPHRPHGKKRSSIDDSTGGKNGIPLSDEVKDALTTANLPLATPGARRQRQGRRRQDARHDHRQRRPAGLFRRRRHQGRAADVQGAQQAVRAGVLVARSRRQPAQPGRQPQHRSRPASTARPRSPASRTPTTISRNCARRWTSSASPRPPTSSSPPTTASRPSRRRARPAPSAKVEL